MKLPTKETVTYKGRIYASFLRINFYFILKITSSGFPLSRTGLII